MGRSLIGFAGWFCLVAAVAAVGAFASRDAADFYGSLVRPAWAPPASVFGPVWTVLYALMAIAAWRVWRIGGWLSARRELAFFLAQLVLNGAWSWLFFAMHKGAAAFADILALWICVATTTVLFARRDRPAAWMLAPYLAWVSFAAFLNASVWRLNPALL